MSECYLQYNPIYCTAQLKGVFHVLWLKEGIPILRYNWLHLVPSFHFKPIYSYLYLYLYLYIYIFLFILQI